MSQAGDSQLTGTAGPPHGTGVWEKTRVRLFVMMVLEYAIWGAWNAVAGDYFRRLNLSGPETGMLFAALPLATIISPFVAGQIADRYVNTEKFLGVLHLAGGVLLFMVALQSHYGPLFWLLLAYCLLYAPTLALANSLTFHHLTSSERQFGFIRVGGTIGWILAGWVLGAWRLHAHRAVPGDIFYLAAILSIALGLFAFALPATPPDREGASPLAFVDALALLARPGFAVFMIVSFLVGTELQFHYMLTSQFLAAPTQYNGMGVSEHALPWIMSLGQIGELGVMLALPYILPALGVRKALVLGMIAWPIRYAVFAFLPVQALVFAAMPLHGFCYVFFFVVGFIYVDQVAPTHIRASAQSLYALVVLGLGLYAGSIFAGRIQSVYTRSVAGATGAPVSVTNWHMVFLIPAVLTLACALVFSIAFRDRTGWRAVPAEGSAQVEGAQAE